MELRLYLDPDAPLLFVEPTVAPADAPNAHAWYLGDSDLLLIARTGQFRGAFSDQNASITVKLNNHNRQASKLIGQPLRVRAELYDGATLYFAGFVQDIGYGTAIELDIGA